jgi:WD40 repeat protein
MLNYVGQKFGNYVLVRLLGEGGFANVYLGEHTYLKTYAAIKVLQTQLANDSLEEFLKEARTIASLRHPHIIRVLEFGVEGNTPFLVMDYAPNGSLAQLYTNRKTQSPARIIPHVRQVAEALQYAHDRRMIHRDVKPDNMLLGDNQEVLLSDFGIAVIARNTRSQGKQEVAGTGPYMAPEQIRGMASAKSDQYALGIVVYEWLSGSPPFEGSFIELIGQHLHATPPSLCQKVPQLSPEVEEVVMIALRKEPERRFANISVFARALERASLSTKRLLPHQPQLSIPVSQHTPSALPSSLASVSPVPSPPAPAARLTPVLPVMLTPMLPVPPPSLSPVPQSPLPVPQLPTPGPQQPQPKGLLPVSRRRVVLGLVGLGTVAALTGGTAWFVKTRGTAQPSKPSSVSQPVIGNLLYTYDNSDRVFAVAWSPDGTRIASGSWDKTVQVWDAASGKAITIYTGHSGAINSIAWSPDNSAIVSSSVDGTAQVWAAKSARPLLTYKGHASSIFQYGVSSVAWSHNGGYIASGADDNTVQVWTADTGTLVQTYRGHTNLSNPSVVRAVAWSPNDRSIASGAYDKTVRVWDALTGKTSVVYHAHLDRLCSLAWSPDGQYIVSASDDGEVRVWAVNSQSTLYARSNKNKYTPPPDPLGRPVSRREEDDFYAVGTNVFAVSWSDKRDRIAAVNVGGYILAWDALTQTNISAYSSSTLFVNAVAWSPGGTELVSGNDGNLAQVWRDV